MKKSIVVVFIVLVCCKANEKSDRLLASSDLNGPKQVIVKENISVALYDYKGFERFLNRDDGKTYVINFWATWCKPCVEELPYFEQLYKEYKAKGVTMILVSLDMPKMIETQLIPFIKKKNLQANVIVLDDPKQNTWIPKINENWSGAIPATLMYNRNERAFFEQSFTYATLESELLKLLNSK